MKDNKTKPAEKKIDYLHYLELCSFWDIDPALAFENPEVRKAVKAGKVPELIEALTKEF
jgi:hypothetical protein